MDGATQTSGAQRSAQDRSGDGCPLVLDIDEILLRPGFLIEIAIAYVKANPLRLFRVLWWLAGSWRIGPRNDPARALDSVPEPYFDKVPVNDELVGLARAAVKQGRPVYLATAVDAPIVTQLARRFPFVTGVIGADRTTNPGGEAKAATLARHFPDGFDYAGYACGDLAVCRIARNAALIPVSQPPRRQAAAIGGLAAALDASSKVRALAQELRWLHWTKNLLVFVPILLAGRLTDWTALSNTTLAFVAIGLIASATYLINDMIDLTDDRAHWSKRNRPIASGRLPIEIAAIVAPIGIVLGLAIGTMTSAAVAGFLCLYLTVTLAYSFRLKRIPVVDGLVLAALFTVRIAVGIVAADVRPSPWLLVFSMFLFASLSYAKRYTEIERAIERKASPNNGRGYYAADGPLILAIGAAAGVGAVLIMILYIIEDGQTSYSDKVWLWGLPPLLLLLISRIWLKSSRGEMNDDLIEFVLHDRSSLALAAIMTICFTFAWLGPLWTW